MKIQNAILIGIFAISLIGATVNAQEPQASPTLPKTVEITKSETNPEDSASEENKTATVAETAKPDAAKSAEQPKNPANTAVNESAPPKNQVAELTPEEAAIVPYYSTFMKEYRLGPEDVISVEVFGQPNYSKPNITVPPDGTISYPLIRDGIFVYGKTRQQIADEITKKLDEFIIEPKVTVSLDKAMSKRYSVLGDVGKPGVAVMARRMSVYEAIAEAGGILPTGNKKEVVVLRSSADGKLSPITVSVEVKKGKDLQMVYLEPGDQIIVQGNKIKAWQQIMNMLPIIGFARGMMTGGAF